MTKKIDKCVQTHVPEVDNSVPHCDKLISTDCVIHEEAIPELDLPENSTTTEVIEALVENLGEGTDGEDGGEGSSQTDGVLNKNGTYTWIKYSAYPDGINPETGLSDMFDEPDESDPLYIGLAYNKEDRVESEDASDYIWGNVNDAQQDSNGKWTWIKYADTPYSGISDSPLGKQFIGFSFNNESNIESENYEDYDWSKITGNDGADGIPIAGTTEWMWVKYSIYPNGKQGNISVMVDEPDSTTKYIGLAYNKPEFTESVDADDYEWFLIGADILQSNGKYTWLKYADTPISGISDEPKTSSRYIGLAFDKDLPESQDPASNLYESYQWSNMFMDNDGNITKITNNYNASYTWLKFSEFHNGFDPDTGQPSMTNEPDANTAHIGIAVNKDLPESQDPESEDPNQYDWTIAGEDVTITIDGITYYIWEKYSAYEDGFSSPGVPSMVDIPTPLTVYIGLAYYKITPESGDLTGSEDPLSYEWSRIIDDIEKKPTLYQWMKFADLKSDSLSLLDWTDIDESTMSDSPTGLSYQGFALNKENPENIDPNSDLARFYVWTLIGDDIQLPDGTYVWDKYSLYPNGRLNGDIAGAVSMQDDIDDTMLYIGMHFGEPLKKSEDPRSNDPDLYWWSGVNDIQNQEQFGHYWIKFAQNETGLEMDDFPVGKAFMGIARDKSTYVESDNYEDYVWNPIGDLQDYIGYDGQTYYTWVKWADIPSESVLIDTPNRFSQYMGLAFRKTEEETVGPNGESLESEDYRDYQWFRFEFGVPGHTQQDNIIRVDTINPNELTNGVVNEANIAKYLNEKGFNVSEVENVIFDFGSKSVTENCMDLSKPIDISIVENSKTDTEVCFTWDINGDTDIVRYDIIVNGVGGATYSQNAPDVSKCITGLTPNTNYEVHIIAYDSCGSIKTSGTPLKFSTEPSAIDLIPLLNGKVVGDDIELDMWINPSFNVTGWELWVQGTIVGNEYENLTQITGIPVSNSNRGVYTFTDLEPDTYTFYTQATSVGGNSASSTPNLVLTLASTPVALLAPVITFVSTTDTTFTFSIAENVDTPNIIGYTIFYKINGAGGDWLEVQSNGVNLVQTITGLTPETLYDVKIQAITSTDISVDSNILTEATNFSHKAEIDLTYSNTASAVYEGNSHLRYPTNLFTSPDAGAITEGTSVTFYARFKARGSIKYEVENSWTAIATANYANIQDFFNAEIVTLGDWGDTWTRGYGFDGTGNSFYVRAHRDGTASRSITSWVSVTTSAAGTLAVKEGEPNGWVKLEVEQEATIYSIGGVVLNNSASTKFNELGTVSNNSKITKTVTLDANGEYNDYFSSFGTIGTSFRITGRILESSDGINQNAKVDLLIYTKTI